MQTTYHFESVFLVTMTIIINRKQANQSECLQPGSPNLQSAFVAHVHRQHIPK